MPPCHGPVGLLLVHHDDLAFQQMLTILGDRRRIPHAVSDPQPHKPPEWKVELQMLLKYRIRQSAERAQGMTPTNTHLQIQIARNNAADLPRTSTLLGRMLVEFDFAPMSQHLTFS